jgi:hypothetical protein
MKIYKKGEFLVWLIIGLGGAVTFVYMWSKGEEMTRFIPVVVAILAACRGMYTAAVKEAFHKARQQEWREKEKSRLLLGKVGAFGWNMTIVLFLSVAVLILLLPRETFEQWRQVLTTIFFVGLGLFLLTWIYYAYAKGDLHPKEGEGLVRRWEKLPYSLHDGMVTQLTWEGQDLWLCFDYGYLEIVGEECVQVEGDVCLRGVEEQDSWIFLWKKGEKTWEGEKHNLGWLMAQEGYLEIQEETYGENLSCFAGLYSFGEEVLDFELHICHSGPMEYRLRGE